MMAIEFIDAVLQPGGEPQRLKVRVLQDDELLFKVRPGEVVITERQYERLKRPDSPYKFIPYEDS